jgi:hypothetical protein
MKNHKVKKFGNSGHVLLSKNLVGKYVTVLTIEDDILGLGEIQRLKLKIENLKFEIEKIRTNRRIRNRVEVLEGKSLRIKELEKIVEASEKASAEAES